MSALTGELLGCGRTSRRPSVWVKRFAVVADRLVAAHGVPALGNFRDPVREIFYILLSAKTTDNQYRRTFQALTARFPSLSDLATAEVADILSCIASGGLANKKASQIQRTAAALLAAGGQKPGRRLRKMAPAEVFAFLTRLPGVGPKSALCVMMYSLDADVFPVDVNVQRIAARMGAIPRGLKHYQAQQKLPPLVPAGRSRELHIAMVVHGRTTCLPRKPRCASCGIVEFCRYGRRATGAQGERDG